MSLPRARWAVAAALLALAASPDGPARAAGESGGKEEPKSGAYCPLPKPGEEPRCLLPAQERYGEFFAAIEEGVLDEDDAARVEADLRSAAATDEAYLALSSLAYGYWRMAMKAADTERVDPVVLRRLERWNQLLTQAYQQSAADPQFRDALRRAAADLHANAPAEGLECVDEAGEPTRCRPTLGLMETLDEFDGRLGMRAAILRLLEGIFGGDEGQ